jgi:uncharacterized protein YjbI with pentapeptide repeats
MKSTPEDPSTPSDHPQTVDSVLATDEQACQCELEQDFAKLYKLKLASKEAFYQDFEIHSLANKHNLSVGVIRNMFGVYCCQQELTHTKVFQNRYRRFWKKFECNLRQQTIWITPAKGAALATAIGGLITFGLPLWQFYEGYREELQAEVAERKARAEAQIKAEEDRQKALEAQQKANEIAQQKNIKEAWDTIFKLEGKAVDGGRRSALQYLNSIQDGGSRIDLSGVNLNRAELSGVNLSNALLQRANFAGAKLTRANLSSSSLYEATFSSTTNNETGEVTRANLLWAELYNASLVNANLESAILTRANLRQADLLNTNIQGADLAAAILIEVRNLTLDQLQSTQNWQAAFYDSEWRSQLGEINGFEDVFSEKTFRDLNLKHADLSNINLSRSDFSRSDLSDVNLAGANLVCTRFIETEGLTRKQIIQAANYWAALYDEEFRKEFNKARQQGEQELVDNSENCSR